MSFTYYSSPVHEIAGRILNFLVNVQIFKRLRRGIMHLLPFPVQESDVRDIIYASWVVSVANVAHLIPPGVEVIESNGMTILTSVTYRHGHFGPSIAGHFRRLFPSPLQSNWRLYVKSISDSAQAVPTVLFLANIFDSVLYALSTRLLSDVMLSHYASKFEHRHDDAIWISRCDGRGSAPSWHIAARNTEYADLPPAFTSFFAHYEEAIGMLCLQDAAIAPIAGSRMLAFSEIDLPIAVESVAPLLVEKYVPGQLLRKLGAIDTPFCFRIPSVKFRVISERLITILNHAKQTIT